LADLLANESVDTLVEKKAVWTVLRMAAVRAALMAAYLVQLKAVMKAVTMAVSTVV
jgi:hypothetical protein